MRCIRLFSPRYRSRALYRMLVLVAVGLPVGCRSAGEPPSLHQFSAAGPASTSPATDAETSQPDVVPVTFDDPVVNDQEPVAGAPSTSASFADLLRLDAPVDSTVVPESLPQNASSLAEPRPGRALMLQDLEANAIASHPTVMEARARVDSIRGQYIQAGLPFNPVLQYQSQEIGNEGASGLHSVQMNQQFVTAGKLGLAQQVQAQEIRKQQAQLQIAELRVLTRVRSAFATTAVSQRRAELADRIVELAEQSVRSVEALLEAQEVSRVELLQAKVEAEQASIAAENAAAQLQADRRSLAAAAGVPALPSAELAIDDNEHLETAPWEMLLSEIAATSPEIAAAGSELERARWSLRLAVAQVTPNITGQLGVGVDAASDDTFATVGVSIPLPIRNRNQGAIRSARAEIAASSAALDRTRLSLEGRLAAAVGRYQIARQRYDRLRTEVVPRAEETLELSRSAFEAGETGFLQLLTAQRTLFNTRLSVLDALGQAKTAMAEIEGMLVTLQL